MFELIKCLASVCLMIPLISFSQEPDTLQSARFENFFGSDCPVDTMRIEVAPNDFCVLYSNSYQLCRLKKNKNIWAIRLNEFEKSDYICMVVRPTPSKKTKEYYIFIMAYKDEKEIGRKIVRFPSGKILKTTFSGS